jgi:hypothetical protein
LPLKSGFACADRVLAVKSKNAAAIAIEVKRRIRSTPRNIGAA